MVGGLTIQGKNGYKHAKWDLFRMSKEIFISPFQLKNDLWAGKNEGWLFYIAFDSRINLHYVH